MGYVVKLNQGDYYEARGGYDWGRCDRSAATVFDTSEDAMRVATWLRAHGAVVENE